MSIPGATEARPRGAVLWQGLRAGVGMAAFGLTFVAFGLFGFGAAWRDGAPNWVFGGVIVFASFGAGCILIAAHVAVEALRIDRLRATYPVEPWRWRDDWATGRLRSRHAGSLLPALFLVVSVVGLLALAANEGFAAAALDNRYLLVVAALLAAMAWLLGRFLMRMSTRRWAAESFFVPGSLPILVGAAFEGWLEVPAEIGDAAEMVFRLTCQKPIVDDDNGGWETIWQEERIVSVGLWNRFHRTWRVPVRFEIPPDLPGTDPLPGGMTVAWDLGVSAKLPRRTYREAFGLPVFRSEDARGS